LRARSGGASRAEAPPSMSSAMISIVMPAHNEQGYLRQAVEAVVNALGQRGVDFEVIVSENGSTDGTAAEAEEIAAENGRIRVLRAVDADYGAALRAGLLASRGDVVVNFDVDLVDMGFLDEALELMEPAASVAVVVGSKRGSGSDDRRGAKRRLVTAVYSCLLRRGFGLRVSDTHGLKAMRRAAVLPLVDDCRFDGDIFDTELVLRAERAGLDVREVPVAVAEQRPPRSPLSRRIARTLPGLVRLRLSLTESVPKGSR
jgi:glycosyltransferase involved in cell wall biosynthesis